MTTPAEDLRAAAQILRPSSPAVAAHTVAVRIPVHAADALADWLEAAAEEAETIGTDPHALAVARAINTTGETR